MTPKVSVIMSVYNGERHLPDAMESMLGQTFDKFEFIIINDGSTDKTVDVLTSYDDHRIQIVNNGENLGLTKCLNIGLKMAKCEYIARMDADDVSLPERLERQLNFLERNADVGLVGSYAQFIDENGNRFYVWKMPTEDTRIRQQLRKSNSFCHGSTMYRRECINDVGSYREKFKYAQDRDLWFRISERYNLANIDILLYRMRRIRGSISRMKSSEQALYSLLAAEFAKERQQFDSDSYDQFTDGSVRAFLEGHFGISRLDVRKSIGDRYLQYYGEALRSGDCLGSLMLRSKAFIQNPSKSGFVAAIREMICVAVSLLR
jgi:glycosyltransferase involved in cell wall biosynthesis